MTEETHRKSETWKLCNDGRCPCLTIMARDYPVASNGLFVGLDGAGVIARHVGAMAFGDGRGGRGRPRLRLRVDSRRNGGRTRGGRRTGRAGKADRSGRRGTGCAGRRRGRAAQRDPDRRARFLALGIGEPQSSDAERRGERGTEQKLAAHRGGALETLREAIILPTRRQWTPEPKIAERSAPTRGQRYPP